MNTDDVHMRHALRLAERALGRVAPNPAVGCVLVKNGHVVGRGWTQPGGRPHAETVALAAAGAEAKGATVYVTLEPCSHHGETPPCADALVASGVVRVVGAILDPDTRVNGRGYEELKRAGIAVTLGVCETEARALNAGFIKRVTVDRPLVALKVAVSVDGYVAGPPGSKRWITDEAARRHAHMLRTKFDAILVGIGTVLADDPLLTCRLPGLEQRSPVRIVLDTHLRLPLTSQLVLSARDAPVIAFTTLQGGGEALRQQGATIVRVEGDREGRPSIEAVLHALAARGITRLLVEGGPATHAAFLASGTVDEAYVYRAPGILGGGRRSAIETPSPSLSLVSCQALPPDVLETYAVTV